MLSEERRTTASVSLSEETAEAVVVTVAATEVVTVAKAVREAYQEVEDQEDVHLYHSKGWCRELWIESLGMNAVLPPPEEKKHVTTAIGAARAEQASAKSR